MLLDGLTEPRRNMSRKYTGFYKRSRLPEVSELDGKKQYGLDLTDLYLSLSHRQAICFMYGSAGCLGTILERPVGIPWHREGGTVWDELEKRPAGRVL